MLRLARDDYAAVENGGMEYQWSGSGFGVSTHDAKRDERHIKRHRLAAPFENLRVTRIERIRSWHGKTGHGPVPSLPSMAASMRAFIKPP
jgi:hypothetical protein